MASLLYFGTAPDETGDGDGPTIDLENTSDSGASSSDGITNNTSPVLLIDFTGVDVEDGQDLLFYKNDVLASTVTLTQFQIDGGPISFGLPPYTEGDYTLKARIDRGGGDFSNYGDTFDLSIRLTPPELTSPTGVSTGETTATIGFTTDTPDGSVFYVVTDSATPPDAAQIMAGTDDDDNPATRADEVVITTVGAKTANLTGLSAGATLYAHFVPVDVAGNIGDVLSSASFTTDAGTTPDAIFGDDMLLWFDASVQMSAAQWDDQSGNGKHLVQATAGNRPTADANGLSSGKPGMVFAFSTQDWMQTATFTNGTDEFCVIMVMKSVDEGANYVANRRWSYSTNIFDYGADEHALGQVNVQGTLALTYRNGGYVSQKAMVAGVPCVVMDVFDGAVGTTYVDNVAGTPSASVGLFDTANNFTLNAIWGGSLSHLSAVYSEVIVAKKAPNSGQRAALQSYLDTKWGL